MPDFFLKQSGWSALMAAVYQHHDKIAMRLIEAGATPDLEDKVNCLVNV